MYVGTCPFQKQLISMCQMYFIHVHSGVKWRVLPQTASVQETLWSIKERQSWREFVAWIYGVSCTNEPYLGWNQTNVVDADG